MNMGEKIKALRREKRLTLEEVGNICGVGKSTVRKWENGIIANMRRDKIALLAKALGVSPGYLMGWEDVPMERKAEPGKGAEGSSLTQPEAELVSCYRQLNRTGRDMLLSTARAFAGNPDMTEEKESAQAM